MVLCFVILAKRSTTWERLATLILAKSLCNCIFFRSTPLSPNESLVLILFHTNRKPGSLALCLIVIIADYVYSFAKYLPTLLFLLFLLQFQSIKLMAFSLIIIFCFPIFLFLVLSLQLELVCYFSINYYQLQRRCENQLIGKKNHTINYL